MQHFHFSFIGKTHSRQVAESLLHKNELIRIDKRSLKIREIENPAMEKLIFESQKQIEKSEDYLKKLEDFYRETEIICAEFEVENPYEKAIRKAMKKQKLSESEISQIDDFVEFAERVPTLSTIRRFLIELPETSEFDDLRFHRNLLEINLNFPKLFDDPKKIDSQVLKSFEDFRKIYTKKYLKFLRERKDFLEKFWKENEKILRQKLFAIEVFARIDLLKSDCENLPNLKKEFSGMRANLIAENYDEMMVKKILRKSPFFKNISFQSISPQKICEDFVAKVDGILERILAKIRTKSVLEILKISKKNSVQKLAQVLQFSKIEKIVAIFNKKTADAIAHELQKIFEENSRVLRLGDFASKVSKLESAADAKKLVAEFEKFIEARLKKGGFLILE